MKLSILALLLFIVACNPTEQKNESITCDSKEASNIIDTVNYTPKTYSNERFKDVSIENLGENKFRITGQAQVFEATLNWIVEDGHQEIMKGFQTADTGAPEWGKFDFTIEAIKKQENSTLTLYLFEISAKDGSRQHELPLLLY